MHIHDIKCDYENCNQMRSKDEKNWWIIEYPFENSDPIVGIRVLTDELAEETEENSSDEIAHACSIDHAIKIAARKMEEVTTKESSSEEEYPWEQIPTITGIEKEEIQK